MKIVFCVTALCTALPVFMLAHAQELHRLVIRDREVVKDEIVLTRQGRLRDVASGPDGYLYLLIEDRDHGQSRIVRLMPVDGPK